MNKKYIPYLLILIFVLFLYIILSEPINSSMPNLTTPSYLDENSITGIWKLTLSTGSSAKFTFNKDMTGYIYLDGAGYGDFRLSQQTYFKYTIYQDYIYLTDIHPTLMGGDHDKKLKYDFISRNKLLIGNAVFEKQLW